MSASFRALTLLFCLSLFFSQGFAIRCYVCNSMNDPNCATLSSNSPSYSSNNYLRDCNDLVGGYRYSICRKIDQSVTDPFDNTLKTRTIRECGQDDPATDSCYQKAGFGGRQYVCSCLHDGCNGSTHLQVAFTTLVSFAFLAIIGPKFM